MKKIKVAFLITALIILVLLVFDLNNLIGFNVKSRLYPEKTFDLEPRERSKVILNPNTLPKGGILHINIISGKEGVYSFVGIYKVKAGPDLKVGAIGLERKNDVMGEFSCREKLCTPERIYTFNYRLGTDERSGGEGLYYARIYDADLSPAIAFFEVA